MDSAERFNIEVYDRRLEHLISELDDDLLSRGVNHRKVRKLDEQMRRWFCPLTTYSYTERIPLDKIQVIINDTTPYANLYQPVVNGIRQVLRSYHEREVVEFLVEQIAQCYVRKEGECSQLINYLDFLQIRAGLLNPLPSQVVTGLLSMQYFSVSEHIVERSQRKIEAARPHFTEIAALAPRAQTKLFALLSKDYPKNTPEKIIRLFVENKQFVERVCAISVPSLINGKYDEIVPEKILDELLSYDPFVIRAYSAAFSIFPFEEERDLGERYEHATDWDERDSLRKNINREYRFLYGVMSSFVHLTKGDLEKIDRASQHLKANLNLIPRDKFQELVEKRTTSFLEGLVIVDRAFCSF